jgi:hypothetical protein
LIAESQWNELLIYETEKSNILFQVLHFALYADNREDWLIGMREISISAIVMPHENQ